MRKPLVRTRIVDGQIIIEADEAEARRRVIPRDMPEEDQDKVLPPDGCVETGEELS